jgi:hypothetical protein
MIKRQIFSLTAVLFFSIVIIAFGQQNPKPWENFGLSETEWKMVLENNISVEKLREILRAGIGVGEYVKKPWEKFNMTETRWIAKHRAGMSSYDIEVEATTPPVKYNNDNKNVMHEEMNNFSSNKMLFKSFFLPGYEQVKNGKNVRGNFMKAIAFSAIVGSVVWTIAEDKVNAAPIIVLLVPDMFWSAIDFKVTLGAINN